MAQHYGFVVSQAGVIGHSRVAWSIDNDTQRTSIRSHIGAYAHPPHTEIRTTNSRNEDVCREVQEAYPIPAYYTDYRAMIESENLDVVSVCTPVSPPPDKERKVEAVADITDCIVSKKQLRGGSRSSLSSLKLLTASGILQGITMPRFTSGPPHNHSDRRRKWSGIKRHS